MVAPGCTRCLPLSVSTGPAAIFRSVDLPEPLRPIRQTRSPADTDSSTPDNSGVPPKVSLMSFNWISGGAIANSTLFLRGLVYPLALDAANGLIERRQKRRAVARCERFGTAGHFARRTQIGHQISNRQRHSDRLLRKRLAVRRDHLGAGFHASARQRDIGCNDDIAFSRALGDPVIGGVHPGTRRDALDQRVLRHPNEIAGDHADGQVIAGGDAVDFVFDRTGVGVDIDAGGVQDGRHRLGIWSGNASCALPDARGTPSEAELRGKHGPEPACHGVSFAYDYRWERRPKSGKTGMTSRLEA